MMTFPIWWRDIPEVWKIGGVIFLAGITGWGLHAIFLEQTQLPTRVASLETKVDALLKSESQDSYVEMRVSLLEEAACEDSVKADHGPPRDKYCYIVQYYQERIITP